MREPSISVGEDTLYSVDEYVVNKQNVILYTLLQETTTMNPESIVLRLLNSTY